MPHAVIGLIDCKSSHLAKDYCVKKFVLFLLVIVDFFNVKFKRYKNATFIHKSTSIANEDKFLLCCCVVKNFVVVVMEGKG